jgi:hypothetical protein
MPLAGKILSPGLANGRFRDEGHSHWLVAADVARAALPGMQEVEGAPAHGGAILFLTVPVVGVLALVGTIPAAIHFYRKISR